MLLDATAGSDAGIDVVSSEYATIAAEQTALERLSVEVADQIVVADRALCGADGAAAPTPVKANRAQIDKALKAPAETRFFLFHGPDESGQPGARQGGSARRWAPRPSGSTSTGAELKADPARLADEAASISMFGGARWILVEPAGDETRAGARGAARRAGGGQSGGGARPAR